MHKLLIAVLLVVGLQSTCLANGLFRRRSTCYTPCYPVCPPKKEMKEEKQEVQVEAKAEHKVIVQNNLYMPQVVTAGFQFTTPAPIKTEPLRQFGFVPNMPQYQPQPQPERAQPQPQLTQQQLNPFIIQNVVTTSSSVTSVNNGTRISTTDFTVDQLNAAERVMVSWKKGGAAAALKKIEAAGLTVVFKPQASPFVIVTGKLTPATLQSLRVDPITTIEPDAQGQK